MFHEVPNKWTPVFPSGPGDSIFSESISTNAQYATLQKNILTSKLWLLTHLQRNRTTKIGSASRWEITNNNHFNQSNYLANQKQGETI
jgi:hypothetical protein